MPWSISNRRIPTLFFEPSLVSWWRGLFCLVLYIGREALAKQLPVDGVVALFLSERSLSFLSFIFLDQSVRIARCTPCAVSSSLGLELGNVFSKTISGKNSRNTAVDSFVEESFRNMFFFHGTLAMLIAQHKKHQSVLSAVLPNCALPCRLLTGTNCHITRHQMDGE